MKQRSKEKSAVNVNSVGRFFLFLLCLGLSCLGGWGIVKLWPSYFSETNPALIPLLILEYILISFAALCLVAFFKGGFDRLKKIRGGEKEKGLLFGLCVGLVFGLCVGLIGWILFGFHVVLCIGLCFGLGAGFVAGFITGLTGEFE